MTKTTKIQWTDFTVNFWEGCQKIGPGCDNCYAEARDVRFTGGSHWGAGAPRRWVKNGSPKLRKINRDAAIFKVENDHWPRVFCSSLSDVFDNAVAQGWREEAWQSIDAAPNTRIQLLTKRVGNVEKMMPARWRYGWPSHVGLMITVVNQAEADRDIPKLLGLKEKLGIPWVGLSIEPMLAQIDLTPHLWGRAVPCDGCPMDADCDCGAMPRYMLGEEPCLNWVICGGESGPNARPMHPDWARSLRDQCVAAGVPFFFKQWGKWMPEIDRDNDDPDWRGNYGKAHRDTHTILNLEGGTGFHGERVHLMQRVGTKAAGNLLDGREWGQMPEVTG